MDDYTYIIILKDGTECEVYYFEVMDSGLLIVHFKDESIIYLTPHMYSAAYKKIKENE